MQNVEFDLKVWQNVNLLKWQEDFMVYKLWFDGSRVDYLLWDYWEKYQWYNRNQINLPKRKTKVWFKIT